MTKTNVERTLETLVDFADLNRQATANLTTSIEAMGDRMVESNQRLSDRIDQGFASTNATIDRLGMKIDDLAVQVGTLSESITRLERTVDRQYATAELQSQNVAELIKIVQQLALARG